MLEIRTRSRLRGSFAPVALLALLGALAVAAPSHAVGVGELAPTFNAKDLDGTGTLSLASFRGKVVYLDFWASWCTPCASALPALDALRKEFPAADFQVLAINVDKDPAKARRFLARSPVGYPSVSDPEGHLQVLRWVSTLSRNADFRRFVLNAKSEAEIRDLLEEMSEV